MPNGSRNRARAWCFTLNNYAREDEETIKAWVTDNSASYVVAGREVGEEGTPHLQGYVEWSSKRSLSTIRRLLPRAHWERRRGSAREAASYCKKDNNFFEAGQCSRAGRRSDLQEIQGLIDEGKDDAYIAEHYFSQWVIYRRSFSAYRDLRSNRRMFKSRVEVLVGATGLGKTRYVYHMYGGEDIFVWGGDRWFDGYRGQSIALFDDYEGGLEWSFFLRLLDRYPMQVPVKGGFVEWKPTKIFITSNQEYTQWYPERAYTEPLFRRIDKYERVLENIFE